MKLQWRYFRKTAKSFRSRFLLSSFLSALCAILNVLVPVFLRGLVQGIGDGLPVGWLLLQGFLILICIVLSILLSIALYMSLDSFGGLFIKDICGKIRTSLLSTDMSNVDSLGSNRICHVLYNDVLEAFRVVGHHFPMLFGCVFIIVGTLVLSFGGSPVISLFLAVSVSLGIVISMVSRKAIYKASTATNAKLKNIHGLADQFAKTIAWVRTNEEGDWFGKRFDESIDDFVDVSRQEDKRIYLLSGLTNNFNLVMEILLSILVSIPIAGRNVPNYVFYVFVFSLTMKQGERIEGLLQQILRSEVSFRNIDEIYGLDIPQRDVEVDTVSSIEFEYASFCYGSLSVLNEFNLRLDRGDSLLLEGGNGRGKSTLLKLVRGLYDVKDGSLKLNGVDVGRISEESLHRNVLYVGQDEIVLNGTPIEYLREVVSPVLGASFNDEMARSVLEEVGFDGFCSRSIQENGGSLSGGQLKKLLLAKFLALYSTASVILIDELHSGLDAETKAKLNRLLGRIVERKDKIVVVVSHEDVPGIAFSKRLEL